MDVSVYEAKTHLSRLLADVEAGVPVTITRHGRPVARLVPVEDEGAKAAATAAFLADVRALRAQIDHPPTAEEIVQWIREGRDRKP